MFTPFVSDVDECAIDNGGCGVGGTCVNTQGGHKCLCPKGYTNTLHATSCQGMCCTVVDN